MIRAALALLLLASCVLPRPEPIERCTFAYCDEAAAARDGG